MCLFEPSNLVVCPFTDILKRRRRTCWHIWLMFETERQNSGPCYSNFKTSSNCDRAKLWLEKWISFHVSFFKPFHPLHLSESQYWQKDPSVSVLGHFTSWFLQSPVSLRMNRSSLITRNNINMVHLVVATGRYCWLFREHTLTFKYVRMTHFVDLQCSCQQLGALGGQSSP